MQRFLRWSVRDIARTETTQAVFIATQASTLSRHLELILTDCWGFPVARKPCVASRGRTAALPRVTGMPYRGISCMTQKTELTWATVNTEDPVEMEEFDEQEEQKAGERIHAAFQRLRALGIVDEKGELLIHELPPDMRPGAKRDFGG